LDEQQQQQLTTVRKQEHRWE